MIKGAVAKQEDELFAWQPTNQRLPTNAANQPTNYQQSKHKKKVPFLAHCWYSFQITASSIAPSCSQAYAIFVANNINGESVQNVPKWT